MKGMDDMKYQLMMEAGDAAGAHKAGMALVEKAVKEKNAMALNQIAWNIVDPEANVKNKDLELALKAADEAVKLTKSEDGMILDTLARVYWVKGDKAKAIELQTKAVEKVPAEEKDQIQKSLDEYKKDSK
jgi:tetratricopeptide (TPR) repeat protein